ncbi:MAG: discoidin domain-containing protein [Clostridia bacterium]|nr:discoidin domain-containing protein [Clostridia bacterium]
MNMTVRICLIIVVLLAVLLITAAGLGSRVGASGTLTMTRNALELFIGETDTLTLKKSSENVSWTTSDSSIVTVDKDGNVKGIAVGQAEITASDGETSAVCKVFVVEKEYSFDDDIMISIFWPPTSQYINDEQYKYMADAGITYVMGSGDNLGSKEDQLKMLELCYKYGIRMTVGDSRLGGNLLNMSEKAIKKVVDEYRNVPGANGYYMLDEPYNANSFIDAYRTLKSIDPNSYMHLNFLPYGSYSSVETYKAQMDDWLKLCAQTGYKQDYLMYDLYPFGLEKGSMNRTGFLINLNAAREVGLKNGVKTGTYIQSVTQSVAFRSPTESETRYEINMALAFGFKQLSYFTWFTPYNRSEPFEDGIINYDGVPNPKYEFICRVNGEVKMLGPTLVKCDSLEVYQGRNNYSAMELIPEDFFVQNANKGDFTVAYLRNRENGRNYCMVVNNNFSKAKDFELKFESGIGSLEYISEKDGKVYSQEIGADNIVSLTLEAGAARLFVLPEGYDFAARRKWVPAVNENIALKAQVCCDTSLGSSGWYMRYLNDGTRFSAGDSNGWQPVEKAKSAVIIMDFEQEVEFNRIDIYPAGDRFDYGTHMPSDFTISVSNDGENWFKLASAEGFKLEGVAVPSIKFAKIKARYIRFIVSAFNGGKLQIAEIEVYNDGGGVGDPETIYENSHEERGAYEVKYKKGSNIAKNKSVKASSYPADGSYKSWGWWPDFLVDGDYAKGWTSNVKIHMDNANSTEYAIIDLGDTFSVGSIVVTPLGCWPKDFEISLSADCEKWTTVASEKNSKKPADNYTVDTTGSAPARYLMFRATKLTNTAADGYMLQLGDIEVYGVPYKDAGEAETLMSEYIAAGGKESDDLYTKVKTLLDDPNATQTQLDVAMKAMLVSVGKDIPEKVRRESEKADYNFVIEKNPLETVDDTVVPTVKPGNIDDEPAPEKKSRNAAAAAIIAGIAIVAAIGASAAIIVTARKKKKGVQE